MQQADYHFHQPTPWMQESVSMHKSPTPLRQSRMNQARSEEECGSSQACPDGRRTLGWTRWGQHSKGWSARWPYMWPPMFRSWSPSSTQLWLSWHWATSRPARHNRGREGRKWSECPVCPLGFYSPVQRSHFVADSHLRVESGLVGIGCEQGHAEFLGVMASCLPLAHFTSMAQSWLALALASTMLGAEASRVKSSA